MISRKVRRETRTGFGLKHEPTGAYKFWRVGRKRIVHVHLLRLSHGQGECLRKQR